MKNSTKKTRTKLGDLTQVPGPVEHKELGQNQLRLVTGGLPLEVSQPCSCTQCGDEDCD